MLLSDCRGFVPASSVPSATTARTRRDAKRVDHTGGCSSSYSVTSGQRRIAACALVRIGSCSKRSALYQAQARATRTPSLLNRSAREPRRCGRGREPGLVATRQIDLNVFDREPKWIVDGVVVAQARLAALCCACRPDQCLRQVVDEVRGQGPAPAPRETEVCRFCAASNRLAQTLCVGWPAWRARNASR